MFPLFHTQINTRGSGASQFVMYVSFQRYRWGNKNMTKISLTGKRQVEGDSGRMEIRAGEIRGCLRLRAAFHVRLKV